MTAFYNDNKKECCLWLEELIRQNCLPSGKVQCCDVSSANPKDAIQCHWFAGIGGWARALDTINWPSNMPVWTASLPCQPFSTAGKQKGFNDQRHLWPAFFEHVKDRTPPILFGEQTQSELGRDWLSHILFELDSLGYRGVAADLCGACVGSPQKRQRLYWMAYAPSWGKRENWETVQRALGRCDNLNSFWAGTDDIREATPRNNAGNGGRVRPIKPGIQPMAHGIPSAMVLNGGAGNAIIPQVAALFIRSSIDAIVESI